MKPGPPEHIFEWGAGGEWQATMMIWWHLWCAVMALGRGNAG